MKDFIDLDLVEKDEKGACRKIIEAAKKIKNKSLNTKLDGKNLAMIFEKSSTRTRVSFEVGINQLGGNAVILDKNNTQLNKGETIADTAQVLSRMVDLIMARVNDHQTLLDLAEFSDAPVINGLSDFSHPCQILASIMAIEEKIGNVAGKNLVWFGDANNVLNSYIHGALIFDYKLVIAKPKSYDFCDEQIKKAQEMGAKIEVFDDAKIAAKGADVLIADTWISMGQSSEDDENEKKQKIDELMPFQVNKELMNLANSSAIFTHCLPAYRGYEVSAEVIDDKEKSIIFDEAENRLHAQKAIMLWCMEQI